MSSNSYRGRIAPSPTGYLHLGHAKTFWTAYERCRNQSGYLIYRDEDIDPNRCKKEFSQAALEDLSRLGITWDEGPILQSTRLPLYIDKLRMLIGLGLVYPCSRSRKDIREYRSTRFSSEGEPLFPREWQPHTAGQPYDLDLTINWRFRVDETDSVRFTDLKQGIQSFQGQVDFADFLVWRKEGVPAYELAVVVDDIAMQITEIVRGCDLLTSTARQWLLYGAFGAIPPNFFHEDLVCNSDGEKLAKRNHSLSLRALFDQGYDQESIRKLV